MEVRFLSLDLACHRRVYREFGSDSAKADNIIEISCSSYLHTKLLG